MHSGSRVPELLRQTKVNQEEFVAMTSDSHQEVVGFYVAVDERLAMDVFDTADHLIGQHQNGFDRETAGTEVEEVFERRAEEIHHEDVVFFLLAVISARIVIILIRVRASFVFVSLIIILFRSFTSKLDYECQWK